MSQITAETLAEEIRTRALGADRFIVAIAGPPGAGKSTLSAELVARLGASSAILPMDGYHLENDRLTDMGLLHRKGAPETFDAEGFVALLQEVRVQPEITYPTFDRVADKTVPGGGRIGPETRIIITEGNYLLLDRAPWSSLRPMFDLAVLLDVPRAVLRARLIQRWLDHGMSPADAEARALGNDMVNVDTVLTHSATPDFTVHEAE